MVDCLLKDVVELNNVMSNRQSASHKNACSPSPIEMGNNGGGQGLDDLTSMIWFPTGDLAEQTLGSPASISHGATTEAKSLALPNTDMLPHGHPAAIPRLSP